MLKTERVAIEERMERRILDISMRQVFRLTRGISPRQLPTDHDYSRKKRSAGHAFPSLRQVFRTVLAVKGSLCRAKGAAEKLLLMVTDACAGLALCIHGRGTGAAGCTRSVNALN